MGGRLTREATTTGSVSRMMPSSTSSSTARDYSTSVCETLVDTKETYKEVVVLDKGPLIDRIPTIS
jgi:hypothetical protein